MTNTNNEIDKNDQPLDTRENGGENSPAVNLVRKKIDELYQTEPDAKKEIDEITQEISHKKAVSKHQEFIKTLKDRGFSQAEINQKWHDYYQTLSNQEKHEVWEEFYSNKPASPTTTAPKPIVLHGSSALQHPRHQASLPAPIANKITHIKRHYDVILPTQTRKKAKVQFKSIAVGLASGGVVMLIMLFGLFNERIVTPFITPSKKVTNTPIIGEVTAAIGKDPKIIIPKINVEVPVVYGADSNQENVLQSALEKGVVHYPGTAEPGQNGNGLLFGHSSNNIFNKGEYKFAFLLLKGLEEGDTFALEKGGVRYNYKVFKKMIVNPTDTWVLDPIAGKTATMSLMTCDPPGTSLHRLVVIGEQISPTTSKNLAASKSNAKAPDNNILPSNSPTMWSRFWNFISS